MEEIARRLQSYLAENSAIMTPNDADFATALERWSDIDRQVPALIVQPTSEREIAMLVSLIFTAPFEVVDNEYLILQLQVKEAHQAKVPFVPATGGHSPWSTVRDGLIIDLSHYKDVKVDSEARTVTVKGGVLMKELQLALSEKKLFTSKLPFRSRSTPETHLCQAVANGNTVGVIPYLIGGGISSYSPLLGWACENVLSARIVVASGEIVIASESQNQDLLWAIRGAGQFFGVVTEVTLRAYDQSVIGPDGVRQIGVIFFPPEQAQEVCQTLKDIVNPNDHTSAGHLMAMLDPSKGRVLMAAPQYFGTSSQYEQTFKPLLTSGPVSAQHQDSSFKVHSDHLGWMCPKGEFKRFSQTGLHSIHPENFAKLVDLHRELIETVPGTERSVFTIEWHTKTRIKEAPEVNTCFGLREVDIWLCVYIFYYTRILYAL